MDPVEKKSLDFLVELTRIIRNMQMYSENHPTVKAGVQRAHKQLSDVLRALPSLSFGKGEGVLLIQNKQITEKNPAADRFVKILGDRNISGVIIRQGVPIAEIEAFIKLAATKPEDVVVDGQMKPELLRPFNKISVNEIKYLMVGEDEDLESLTEARKFFNNIFSEEFKGLKGADALQHIGKAIQNVLPKLADMNFENSQEELWEFFEKSVSSFGGAGIRQTRHSLLTSVKSMPPDVQKTLFGQVIRSPQQLEAVMKKFSDERKATMLVDEVKTGAELSGALETLLKNKGELVQLAEALMKKFGGDENQGGDFDRIFQLIQELEGGERVVLRKRGTVIIADGDEQYEKQYTDIFQRLNFDVEIMKDGRELLDKVRLPQNRPDLLVMDVKLPSLSAIEILGAMDMEKIRIPVLLCTEMVSVENSFEVQMYPKLKFLTKPFNMKDFIDGVDELSPKIEEVAAKKEKISTELSPEMKAELSKAREIQRNLMPRQFPKTPGYELHAFYKACDDVGGDYYDVIPIGPDHIGVMIADVSGHGISGAMVMVMVRSAIRTWAHSTTSPKELLAKVNPIIVRDMIPGMFVTIYYSILDMTNKKLTSTCAGHNPAVYWSYQTRDCRLTDKGGMPLGILSGAAFEATLKEEVIDMQKGDRLLLYTDGFVETMSPDYEEYGEERLFQAVNKVAIQRSDICIKHIVHALTSFQSTAPQHDDLTIVTLRLIS